MAENASESSIKMRTWPFSVFSLLFLILGTVLFMIYIENDYMNWQSQLIPFVFILISMLLTAIPELRKNKVDISLKQLSALQDLSTMLADIDVIKREHFKERAAIESLHSEWQSEMSHLKEVVEALSLQASEKKELEGSLIEKRMECVSLKKESEEWANRAVDYFDFIERTMSLPGLNPDYLNAIQKAFGEFERTVAPMGLIIIRPTTGDAFDGRIHEAKGEEAADGVEKGRIARALSWGYQLGPKVVRSAEVMLAE